MCAARNESEAGALLNHILRTDLTSFVQKSFGTVSPGDTFSPNWHIEAMCHREPILEVICNGPGAGDPAIPVHQNRH